MTGFKDHFSGHASAYASFRPTYPSKLVDVLAEHSPGTHRVWDVGCGSGQLSTLLTARFDEVEATDASAAQLEKAAPTAHVRFRCAPAEASGLEDSSVDCIVAAQAAHWFDMEAFSTECQRVGRPGALVALVTYGLMFIEPAIDEALKRFAYETLAHLWPPERKHVDEAYASLHFPFSPVAVPPVDMEARWALPQVLGYVGTWSSVAALRATGDTRPLDDFATELARRWGPPSASRTVRWPLGVRAGRVAGHTTPSR